MRPVAYLITNRRRAATGGEDSLIRRIGLAARAGVHLIQIRERDMSDGALLALVARAVAAVQGTRARVLVNDRLDVAVAAGAHGVHLRSDSAPAARLREVAPSSFLIGRSVHSPEEAGRVTEAGGVDFLLFGAVFETSSKPGQTAAGIPALRSAVEAAHTVPTLAIGGITPSTAAGLGLTGCVGYGAIGMFADADERALAGLVAVIDAAWEDHG